MAGQVLQYQFPVSFNPLSWTPAYKTVASKILFHILCHFCKGDEQGIIASIQV